ncbi:MAG: glycoside hydrolase family 18 protein [Candidatus Tumulicola sp.]
MMTLARSVLVAALAAGFAACGANPLRSVPAAPSNESAATASPNTAPSSPDFIGFWESWSDTNEQDAFYKLGSVPATVTTADVAFSIADGNQISDPQNTYALLPGARRIHAHGGKVLLSFGGATSNFNITDPKAFVKNLKAYLRRHPGIYDGFDFDDEVIQTQTNGRQQLIGVLEATRAAFPSAVISFDADSAGADPHVDLANYSGEDRSILKKAGYAVDYVNVMDYDQFGWKPSTNPSCAYTPGSHDDCYLDIINEFANVPVGGGKTFPKSKIVMGLMIGEADDGSFLRPGDCANYASWARDDDLHGIMIWDLDLDNPQAPMNGTGYPKGSYVKAIAGALGT